MNHRLAAACLPAGILINLLGGGLNQWLESPIFLDSVGTILAAAVTGPWLGAAVGFLSNVAMGFLNNPVAVPFGIVNAAIGIVVGLLSRWRGFVDPLTPLWAALILTIVCPLLATPIAVYLFGGVTGGYLDRFATVMVASGYQIFSSAFLVRIPANFADKLVSAYLVAGCLRLSPSGWRGMADGKSGGPVPAGDGASGPEGRGDGGSGP